MSYDGGKYENKKPERVSNHNGSSFWRDLCGNNPIRPRQSQGTYF